MGTHAFIPPALTKDFRAVSMSCPSILPAQSHIAALRLDAVTATSTLRLTGRLLPVSTATQRSLRVPSPLSMHHKRQGGVELSISALGTNTGDTIPPEHDRAILRLTNAIASALEQGEAFAPGSMDLLFARVRDAISEPRRASSVKNDTNHSAVRELALNFLDVLSRTDDPEGKREYLYLVFKIIDILDVAITRDTRAHTQSHSDRKTTWNNPYRSRLFSPLNAFLTEMSLGKPMGLLTYLTKAPMALLGLIKTPSAADANRFLDPNGEAELEHLSGRLQLAIRLAVAIETGQDYSVEELVEAIPKLGIPATKLAQTLGAQAANPAFDGKPSVQRALMACKILQENNSPMSAQEAQAQMAAQYEPVLGPSWRSELFKDIDFNKPYRTATIAGTYIGLGHNGQKLLVKLKKPDLRQRLQRDRAHTAQIFHAFYEILEACQHAQQRLGRKNPLLLEQIQAYKNTQAATNRFFERFEQELDFEKEAASMMRTPCRTPRVRSVGPNAIIMDFINDGLSPSDYADITKRLLPIDHARASSAQEAVSAWLKSRYPLTLSSKTDAITIDANTGCAEVHFEDEKASVNPLNLIVYKKKGRWEVLPLTPVVDFSDTARRQLAMQFAADLIKQLRDGLLNCDAHNGNFLIAPNRAGKTNQLYHIDFGLTDTVGHRELDIAGSIIKGALTRNTQDIARAYLEMTLSGSSLACQKPAEWAQTLKDFTRSLESADYMDLLLNNSGDAMGPVFDYFDRTGFEFDEKYFGMIRAMEGVSANIALLQREDPITLKQLMQLLSQIIQQ